VTCSLTVLTRWRTARGRDAHRSEAALPFRKMELLHDSEVEKVAGLEI
jgi:hypothetical protein